MQALAFLEVTRRGTLTVARILDRPYENRAELEGLTQEWSGLAGEPECRTLLLDCSNLQYPSSDMLSKLILLDRQLKHREARLILSGIPDTAREVLHWTKLDRFFHIIDSETDLPPEFAMEPIGQ